MKKMKKIYIYLQVIGSLLFLSSCEDDVEKFVVNETSPIVLSELSNTNIELDQINFNNPAVTLNWTNADYGQQTPVNYNIEIASDSNFTNSNLISAVTGLNSVTFSMAELNAAVGEIGIPPFAWNTVYARVTSSLGTNNGLPVVSNSISFEVYPYFNYPFMDYYLVGNACEPNWNNNNNNPPLYRQASDSDLYIYTGYFIAGSFKFLEIKGLWQPQWGTNDGTSLAVNPGGGSDPGTFDISANGYYTFTANFADNSYSIVDYDASSAINYTSMQVEGSAVSTSAMIQSTFDSHKWHINNIHLTQGNLTFKNNLGEVWGSNTEFSGQAILDGGSIPVVVEDDYDIWYDDLTGHYILIPQNL